MNLGYVFDLRNATEIAKKLDPAFENVTWQHSQIPDLSSQFKEVSWETYEASSHSSVLFNVAVAEKGTALYRNYGLENV